MEMRVFSFVGVGIQTASRAPRLQVLLLKFLCAVVIEKGHAFISDARRRRDGTPCQL